MQKKRIRVKLKIDLSLTEHGNFNERKKNTESRKKRVNSLLRFNWFKFLKPELLFQIITEIVKSMF